MFVKKISITAAQNAVHVRATQSWTRPRICANARTSTSLSTTKRTSVCARNCTTKTKGYASGAQQTRIQILLRQLACARNITNMLLPPKKMAAKSASVSATKTPLCTTTTAKCVRSTPKRVVPRVCVTKTMQIMI